MWHHYSWRMILLHLSCFLKGVIQHFIKRTKHVSTVQANTDLNFLYTSPKGQISNKQHLTKQIQQSVEALDWVIIYHLHTRHSSACCVRLNTGHHTQNRCKNLELRKWSQYSIVGLLLKHMTCLTVAPWCSMLGRGLFVVCEALSDSHFLLPWNHCLLLIQRNSLLSKQLSTSLHVICNHTSITVSL